jgi:hypothetical protein
LKESHLKIKVNKRTKKSIGNKRMNKKSQRTLQPKKKMRNAALPVSFIVSKPLSKQKKKEKRKKKRKGKYTERQRGVCV